MLRSLIESDPRLGDEADADLSDRMFIVARSIREKYKTESENIPTDKTEIQLDALCYAIALTTIHAVDRTKAEESLLPIALAVEGDFSDLKKWLEYHARPNVRTVIQSELNLANLL